MSGWFNLTSPDTYPVVGAPVTFQLAIGSPEAEEGVLQWVHPRQCHAFVPFVQTSYYQLVNPRLESTPGCRSSRPSSCDSQRGTRRLDASVESPCSPCESR